MCESGHKGGYPATCHHHHRRHQRQHHHHTHTHTHITSQHTHTRACTSAAAITRTTTTCVHTHHYCVFNCLVRLHQLFARYASEFLEAPTPSEAKQHAFSQWPFPKWGKETGLREGYTVRSAKGYRYTRYVPYDVTTFTGNWSVTSGDEELYDYNTDPWETTNFAADPKQVFIILFCLFFTCFLITCVCTCAHRTTLGIFTMPLGLKPHPNTLAR